MRYFLLTFFLFCCFSAFSQTTYFNSRPIIDGKESTRIYSLENFSDHVIVTIEIEAIKHNHRINYWCSPNTFLYVDGIKWSQVLGYYVNGRIELCGYNHQWGWSNVSAGTKNYYKLYFGGVGIPAGSSTVSIVDEGERYWNGNSYGTVHSYCFRNYSINSPRKDYTSITGEYSAKKKIDENNDGICGIYEMIGEPKYKLACINESGTYKLIYLESTLGFSWWKAGDVKATLMKTASSIYKAKWYMSDKSINNDAYVVFDGVSMKVTHASGPDPGERIYLKTYPDNDGAIGTDGDKSGKEWTGTGFALKNGYIITNHHVVNGAKSILVLGINGNAAIEYNAVTVSVDKNNDLALIRISDTRFGGFDDIPYAIVNKLCDVGEDVFVLGYPLTTYMGEEIKLTNGIISSKSGYQGDITTYQISAPIQPGNSGGPMFDSKGNIVGVINAGIPGAENVGYAIKTSYLYNLVESAVSLNIIPKTNTIQSSSLSDKTREVKNFVFFIKCKG